MFIIDMEMVGTPPGKEDLDKILGGMDEAGLARALAFHLSHVKVLTDHMRNKQKQTQNPLMKLMEMVSQGDKPSGDTPSKSDDKKKDT